jgi:hypothetical protein
VIRGACEDRGKDEEPRKKAYSSDFISHKSMMNVERMLFFTHVPVSLSSIQCFGALSYISNRRYEYFSLLNGRKKGRDFQLTRFMCFLGPRV